MKISPAAARLAAASLVAAATLGLLGCPNPNAIGVQQYGNIQVTCQNGSGQPVAGALVSATGGAQPQTTDGSGMATLTQVAIGQQTVNADAPGLHGQGTVGVTEGVTSKVTIVLSPT
jgi:hypothetical protein